MPQQESLPRYRRLSAATLGDCGARAALPEYPRDAAGTGIVHLGLGAFHRAHQAAYTDRALAEFGGDWKIIGVSLRSPSVRDRLKPQDSLYTLAEMNDGVTNYRIVGSIERVLVAPEDSRAVIDAMCARSCRIVSLTITEKGYCHDPATGKLDTDHAGVRHDRQKPSHPVTALGFITESLAIRRERGLPVPTILCCDNLPSNGDTLSRLVTEFAALRDPDLAAWIAEEVPFPNSMVDRIVPATQPEDIEQLRAVCGYVDKGTVKTESFSQWVIEDRFANGRPRWEAVGVDMVQDVNPFELAKLRLLNGAHSAIAYLGYLAGYQYVHEVMADKVFCGYLRELMREEVIPTLAKPQGVELAVYADDLLERFANRALRHRLRQIAMDGSQKIPQRWLATIRERLRAGAGIERLTLALAAWIRYVMGYDETGAAIDVQDPLAEVCKQIEQASTRNGLTDTQQLIDGIFGLKAIFAQDLGNDTALKSRVAHWLELMLANGVSATLKRRNYALATQEG